ncbi:slc25a42 [Symbiodinium sp. CCMP2456]|nr:slc25a42 [Symbiodinium sp. CCMP2456]
MAFSTVASGAGPPIRFVLGPRPAARGKEPNRFSGLQHPLLGSWLATAAAAAVAIRSHSRPQHVPPSRRERMLMRPETTYSGKTGKSKRSSGFFLATPTHPKNSTPVRRSPHAAGLRYRLKQCHASRQLLDLLHDACMAGSADISVFSAAVQRCGHKHWWGPLQHVLHLQQTREIKSDIVHVSSVLHSLATCLRQKGRFAVVPARAQKALEVGRKVFDEGKDVVTTDAEFSILLSSTFKLCYQIADARCREWALEAWEWSSNQAFAKDALTWQAYLSLSERYGEVRLVDRLLTQGQSEGASWTRDPVALGGLLNAAANRCDAARARAIWDTFRLTGLRPNMICYAAYSKAHMLAGNPSKAVDIIEEMERKSVADMNSKIVVDCGQCLLIVYHSSPSELTQQRLLKFLARGDKIIGADKRGNAKNEWRKIKKTADQLLSDATALRLHDVLCEWKAQTASVMKDWEDFDADTDYLIMKKTMRDR